MYLCVCVQIEHYRARPSDSSPFEDLTFHCFHICPSVGPAQPLQFLCIRSFHNAVARHFGLGDGSASDGGVGCPSFISWDANGS